MNLRDMEEVTGSNRDTKMAKQPRLHLKHC